MGRQALRSYGQRVARQSRPAPSTRVADPDGGLWSRPGRNVAATLAQLLHGVCRGVGIRSWPRVVCQSLLVRAARAQLRRAMFTFYNMVAYQVAWFACVLSAAFGMPWLGAASAL